jgi:glutathione S-transferase
VADTYLFGLLSGAPKLGVDLTRPAHRAHFNSRVAGDAAAQAAMAAAGLRKAV